MSTAQQPASQGFDFWHIAKIGGLMYLGSNILNGLVGKFGPQPDPQALQAAQTFDGTATTTTTGSETVPVGGTAQTAGKPQVAIPVWPKGASLDMYIYFTTSNETDPVNFDADQAAVVWRNIEYGPGKIALEKEMDLELPESVRHNGSFFADIFLTNGHGSPDPRELSHNPADVYHSRKQLTRYLPKKRVRKEKLLIGGSTDLLDVEHENEADDTAAEVPIVSYWHQNLTLGLVTDRTELNLGAIPPEAKEFIALEPTGRKTADGKLGYLPIVFPNDFWNLRNQFVEINATTTTLPIRITLSDLSHWKFMLYSNMGASLEKQAAAAGGSGGEMDELKRMLIETNPWLLGSTVLVSILHMLFEFLAFSSDVSHWRKKDGDLTGVSLRTILTNCFTQLVILLYLLDNNSDTSWTILLGQGMGLLVEAWKITKIVDIRLVASESSFLPYSFAFEDKKVLSESEKLTQEYDALAFRLVSYVAIPVLGGYAVYSLMYETHRSWYSYVVTTAAQAIYMFGFANLIPALIINYKLKSVAHMSLKTMTYKVLSTVVDDFFSFVVTMPWLHRIACFRDDAVFVVLLYQRWIYRVDPRRENEYGQVSGSGLKETEKEGKTIKDGAEAESKKEK